jgi:hypothetical protein
MKEWNFVLQLTGIRVKYQLPTKRKINERLVFQLQSPRKPGEHVSATFCVDPEKTGMTLRKAEIGKIAQDGLLLVEKVTQPEPRTTLTLGVTFSQDMQKDWLQKLLGRAITVAAEGALKSLKLVNFTCADIIDADAYLKLQGATISNPLAAMKHDFPFAQAEESITFNMTATRDVKILDAGFPGPGTRWLDVVKLNQPVAEVDVKCWLEP